MSKESIKIKLNRKRILIILLLALLVFDLYYFHLINRFLDGLFSCHGFFKVTCVNYKNIILNFRENLKDAQKISVVPSESSINSEFSNDKIRNITIAYKPNENEIPIITVESVEIVNKLKYFYLSDSNRSADVLFNVLSISSFENISGSVENPIIIIKTPSQSLKNQVSSSNFITTIEGRNLKELDIATIKFIMVVLGLKA